jgi:hypothetical protein
MPQLRLRNRADSLFALFASAVASVAVLGSAVLLFADAARTPAFDHGSRLAQRASTCAQAPSMQARHQCLRDVASAPVVDMALVARSDARPLR